MNTKERLSIRLRRDTRKTDDEIKNELLLRRNIVKETNCWLWPGQNINGRGHIYIGRFENCDITKQTSRESYRLFKNTSLPVTNDVLHNCNNSLCYNPDYLYEGTHTDNMQDTLKYPTHRGSGSGTRRYWQRVRAQKLKKQNDST